MPVRVKPKKTKKESKKAKEARLLKELNEYADKCRAYAAELEAKAKERERWREEANKELQEIAIEVDKQLTNRPFLVKLFKKFF